MLPSASTYANREPSGDHEASCTAEPNVTGAPPMTTRELPSLTVGASGFGGFKFSLAVSDVPVPDEEGVAGRWLACGQPVAAAAKVVTMTADRMCCRRSLRVIVVSRVGPSLGRVTPKTSTASPKVAATNAATRGDRQLDEIVSSVKRQLGEIVSASAVNVVDCTKTS